MKPKKFWNWTRNEETQARILHLNGTIAEESWFDDDVTPQLFEEELLAEDGDVTVWINSPGGDCVAAAQIYNMLKDYKGSVTIKVDGDCDGGISRPYVACFYADDPQPHDDSDGRCGGNAKGD